MHNYIINFSLTISHWIIYKYASIFIIVFIYNPMNFIYAFKKFILRLCYFRQVSSTLQKHGTEIVKNF